MDDYGSITIDNKNLLDDLLGLGNQNEPNPLQQATTFQQFQNEQNIKTEFNNQFQNTGPFNNNNINFNNNDSNNLDAQGVLGRKLFLESPTFTKGENDIYRYVYSRISSAEPDLTNRNLLNDSLDAPNINEMNDLYFNNNNNNTNLNNDADKPIIESNKLIINNNLNNEKLTFNSTLSNTNNNTNNSSNTISSATNSKVAPQPAIRIGPSRLLSDLAVATLPKLDYAQPKQARANNLEHPIYENDLVDSLDTTTNLINNNNNISNTNLVQNLSSNSFRIHNTSLQNKINALNSSGLSNNNNNNHISSNQNQQAFILENQFRHQQQQQQQVQQQQQQQSQYQPIIVPPLQTQQLPGTIFTLLPSPTSNGLPIVQSSLSIHPSQQSSQFVPIPIQQPAFIPAQSNMFYQEPIQPMFYNTAYPLNFGAPYSNNYYANQPNDYSNDPYQYHGSDLLNQYQNNQMNQQQQQQPYLQQPQNHQQQSLYNSKDMSQNNKNKYEALPLNQPPNGPVPPRINNNNKNNHHLLSQQSNESYGSVKQVTSPESYEDEGDLNNDFGMLKVNNYQANGMNEDDLKRQEVWNKLQKNRQNKEKHSSGSKTKSNSGLPPVSKPVTKKPPLNDNRKQQQQQQEPNHLERNIEMIKNKENLTHRYPQKSYENVHGKNLTNRLKNFQGSVPKKPPHHLQPIENYENEEEINSSQKFNSMQTQSQEDIYSGFNSNKKISIPLDSSVLRDKDRINLDINLRLVDFMPNHAQNRSLFELGGANEDPLERHIRRYETNISRSLPGSSGSLNKTKPLPPLNRRINTNPNSTYPSSYSNNYPNRENKLQHEYDSEIRSEDGYLAQLQKAQNKPVIKTYTLKDYRIFKKDAVLSNNSTGKLGFDYDNENYKKRVEVTQKKTDYAERVKARNRLLIAEQQRKDEELESVKTVSEPSKTQRAKEYVKNNVIRPRSGSLPNEIESDPKNKKNTKMEKNALNDEKNAQFSRTIAPVANSNFNSNSNSNSNTNSNYGSKPKKIDLNSNYNKNKENSRPNDTAMVRIRDPVTSKVKTLFLNDSQIEELSKRHQKDKEKVNTFANNNNNNNNNTNKTQNYNNGGSPGIILHKPKQPVDLTPSKLMVEYDKKLNTTKDNEDDFEKLIERHNKEKVKVNNFKEPRLQEKVLDNTDNEDHENDYNNDDHSNYYNHSEIKADPADD